MSIELTIIENTGTSATTGFFAGYADDSQIVIGFNTFTIDYNAGTDANDVVLHFIPEPTSGILLLASMAPLFIRRHRRIQ